MGDRKCLVAEKAFDDNLERLDGGFDIWGMSWLGNFGVVLVFLYRVKGVCLCDLFCLL